MVIGCYTRKSNEKHGEEMKRVEKEFNDKGWNRQPSIVYDEKEK